MFQAIQVVKLHFIFFLIFSIQELGVIDNPNYKITFMLDSAAMITVHTPKRGVVEVSELVALAVYRCLSRPVGYAHIELV